MRRGGQLQVDSSKVFTRLHSPLDGINRVGFRRNRGGYEATRDKPGGYQLGLGDPWSKSSWFDCRVPCTSSFELVYLQDFEYKSALKQCPHFNHMFLYSHSNKSTAWRGGYILNHTRALSMTSCRSGSSWTFDSLALTSWAIVKTPDDRNLEQAWIRSITILFRSIWRTSINGQRLDFEWFVLTHRNEVNRELFSGYIKICGSVNKNWCWHVLCESKCRSSLTPLNTVIF